MTMDPSFARVQVCAVTPVFNRKELTLACLTSLFGGDLSRIDLHAIVVDDGSTDGTAEAIREAFPQVEIIRGDGSLWYSEGTNVGVRAALRRRPDFVLLYNNDSLFPPECLATLVDCAERHPTSLVGAVLVDWDRPETIFQVGTSWQTSYGGWRTWMRQTLDDLPSGPFPVETIVGNCVLVPAAALVDAGLMKSATLPNFGDAELTTRMRRRGWRLLIEPAARVLCQPNTPPRRLSSMGWSELVDALWRRRTSYHNLKQRYAANMGGAPAPWQGLLATGIYCARLALKSAGLAGRWPNGWPERPLRTMFVPLRPPLPGREGEGRLVVFGWPYVEWGGVQVYLINLMKAAKARGYAVAAVLPHTTHPSLIDMVRAETDQVWLFDRAEDLGDARTLGGKLQRRWRTWLAHRAFAETILAHAPRDALVQVDVGPWSSAGVLRRLLSAHGVIMAVHTGLPHLGGLTGLRWRRAFGSVMEQRRFRLIAANGEARRSLAPYVSPAALDRVSIAPSSFDPERIAAALAACARPEQDFERVLGLQPADFRIVVGAQFIERKGYRDLLAALEILRKRKEAVACLWIAPIMPPDDVRAILDEERYLGLIDLRCQDDIGPAQTDYLACIARLANVFVLASHLEGLPLALVEAMALGVPCISTDINGIPEAVRHGRNGLLVPPRDPPALAEAIARLAREPDTRQSFGAMARSDAFATYAIDRAGRPVLAAYEDLSALRSAP
ncbi:glycosyltransferase [Phreatobacter aquaticus]|uniref:Glycosyltransferase n=1 Tax=Phreatobacter aquaticus TaxID=2570229 RepID=A0A4D7QJA4_9HYPH|nr:glycosyltransferase [Phreatobacter aquaticus]QCK87608.1 glycosyltransferase [Phreatobacter aquaticus]